MFYYPEIKNVHFEPSSLCNARCPVCPRYLMGGLKNELLVENAVSFEQFKKWFPSKFLKRLDRFQMCGNYGDPMTTPDMLKIVQYLRDSDCPVLIHTNGGLRDRKFWHDLGTINKNTGGENVRVIFAIDGLEDTNHLYRRGVEWDKLINNVKAYIDAGGHAQWSWLRFNHNKHQLEEARQLSVDLGFRDFFSKHPFGFTMWRTDEKQKVPSMLVLKKDGNYDYEMYPEEAEEFNDISEKVEKQVFTIPKLAKDKMHVKGSWEESVSNNELSCYAIRLKEIYISSKGQVHPCCFLSGYVDMQNKTYQQHQYTDLIEPYYDELNLNNNSLEEIMNSKFFQRKMVQGMKPGPDRIIGCSVYCTKKN